MKRVFTIAAIIYCSSSFAQKLNVISKDNKSREYVMERIKDEGLGISLNESDYTIEIVIEGEYNPVSIKRTHQGHLVLSDSKTKQEISRTKSYKATPVAVNGYNASYAITKKACSKELVSLLKLCK